MYRYCTGAAAYHTRRDVSAQEKTSLIGVLFTERSFYHEKKAVRRHSRRYTHALMRGMLSLVLNTRRVRLFLIGNLIIRLAILDRRQIGILP